MSDASPKDDLMRAFKSYQEWGADSRRSSLGDMGKGKSWKSTAKDFGGTPKTTRETRVLPGM